MFNVTATIKIYLKPLAIVTSIRKDQSGSFNMPATNVIGSPIIGIQLNNREIRPYFL